MSFVVAAVIGAGGAIGGALIGSRAAGKAAETQSESANYAADLQYKAQQDALALQEKQWQQTQENYAPWLTAGRTGLTALLQGMGLGTLSPTTTTTPAGPDPYAQQRTDLQAKIANLQNTQFGPDAMITPEIKAGIIAGFQAQLDALPPAPQSTSQTIWGIAPTASGTAGVGDLMAPWTKEFQAPTLDETNNPGYAFRLAEGQKAIEHGAAARGNALSGAGLKAALRYSQNYASSEYDKVYDRAKGEFETAYNIFKANQNDRYNKLAGLSGVGQTTASQLNSAGQRFADSAGNIYMNTAGNVGNLAQNAANARASGYVAGGNMWNQALGGIGNNVMNSILMNQILSNPGSFPTYGNAAATGVPRIMPPLFG